jgi:hypothetical protein
LEFIWNSGFGYWILRRKAWHIRKQEEAHETAEIVQGNVWASNDSAASGSRQETSWSVRKELGFIPERMWEWGRIIPFLPESTGSSNMRIREEIKNR